MSKISAADVKKLATLSGLTVTDDEVASLAGEIEAIIGYVEQLDAIDTTGVEPTYQVTGLKNVTREDVLIDYGVSRADLLGNAPDSTEDSIKVPKVI